MREIKFRVWDNKNKEWLSPNHFTLSFSGDLVTLKGLVLMNNRDFNIVLYAGLKDKNGVEIYEDDIIEDTRGEFRWRYQVKWSDKGAWCAYAQEGDKLGRRTSTNQEMDGRHKWDSWAEAFHNKGLSYCEIIGNIHENPALLKENQ